MIKHATFSYRITRSYRKSKEVIVILASASSNCNLLIFLFKATIVEDHFSWYRIWNKMLLIDKNDINEERVIKII
jgi:hypothetical protein